MHSLRVTLPLGIWTLWRRQWIFLIKWIQSTKSQGTRCPTDYLGHTILPIEQEGKAET